MSKSGDVGGKRDGTELIPVELVADLRSMIEETRAAVAVTVNARLTMLYWSIGRRINQEILGNERGDYGKQIVVTVSRQLGSEYGEAILATLSQELSVEYGRSFSENNLRRMIQFATVFPEEEIVASLIRHLSWTPLQAWISLNARHARDFFSAEIRLGNWILQTLCARLLSPRCRDNRKGCNSIRLSDPGV